MTLRRKFRLHYRTLLHSILHALSTTYRESSSLQSALDVRTAALRSTEAKLALSEARLAETRGQLQTTTLAAQRASEEAAQLRDERDRAREQALEAREGAVRPMQQLVDWFAQGQPRSGVFGILPPPRAEEPPPDGIQGAMRGRAVVAEENRVERQFGWEELREIQERQRRRREEAMQPVYLVEDEDVEVGGA